MSVDNLKGSKGRPFVAKTSGNPGGRPSLSKAWHLAVGKSNPEVFAEALRCAWDVMCEGPHRDHNGNPNDPNWRFAMQKVLEYSGGKAKEHVEVTGNVSPESLALLESMRLTPHDRRKLEAQDSTAAEDEAAMAELTDGDDSTHGG